MCGALASNVWSRWLDLLLYGGMEERLLSGVFFSSMCCAVVDHGNLDLVEIRVAICAVGVHRGLNVMVLS